MARRRGSARSPGRAPDGRAPWTIRMLKRCYHKNNPFMPDFKDQPLHASTSEAVTKSVRVEVESQYAPERSQPHQNEWFFYYTIRITNESSERVQLLSRHWIITDATSHSEEVKGPGVVGETPVLAPGESFQYTSGCNLKTSTGVMRGTYQMVTEEGGLFDVEIAAFALHEPYTVH
jgi:ApaG protein